VAGWMTTPATPCRDRAPPGHRPGCAGRVPQRRCQPRDPGLDVDRQRHGLHHRLAGEGRPQRHGGRTAPPRRGPEELPTQPSHHLRQSGTVQQTPKKWLAAQPAQPTTIGELQALPDRFVDQYNHHRPHRSLPHRATPTVAYAARQRPPLAIGPTTPTAASFATASNGAANHPAPPRQALLHRHWPNPRPNPAPLAADVTFAPPSVSHYGDTGWIGFVMVPLGLSPVAKPGGGWILHARPAPYGVPRDRYSA
jgi:hypothetical protein